MSIIAGALTVEGYASFNAPGVTSGILCDGAELPIPVPSDWNATIGEAQILNKPTALSQFTNDLKAVLGDFSIPGNLYIGGAAAAEGTIQIPADWLQADMTKADFIKNKPLKLSQFTNDLTSVSGDFTVPGNLIVEGNANVTPGESSGQVNADWNATSGAAQILNKPQIPVTKKVPWTDVTFQNGVSNVSFSQQPCQYCIDEQGYVRIRGYVTNSNGNTIFSLPTAAIPAYPQQFACPNNQTLLVDNVGNVSQMNGTLPLFINCCYQPIN